MGPVLKGLPYQRRSFLRKKSIARPTTDPVEVNKSKRNLEGSFFSQSFCFRYLFVRMHGLLAACSLLSLQDKLLVVGDLEHIAAGKGLAAVCCTALHAWTPQPQPRGDHALLHTRAAPTDNSVKESWTISGTLQSKLKPTHSNPKTKRTNGSTPLPRSHPYYIILPSPPKKPVPQSTSISSVRHRRT